MSYNICSAKLCELDSRIARMHAQINSFEGMSAERLKDEINLLSADIKEHRKLVQNSLTHIKIDLSEKTKNDLAALVKSTDDMLGDIHSELYGETDRETRAEKQALAAEYALDLAMITAECAFLMSLEAVDAERTVEKEETTV